MIVINQVLTPHFIDWVNNLASQVDGVEVWSGNPPDEESENVRFVKLASYNRSTTLARLKTWGRFTLQATIRLLRQACKQPVFMVSNPPLMILVAPLLKRLAGIRYGLLEWDIYPQIAHTMGVMGQGHIIYRIWHRMHAAALKEADLIVTIGKEMGHTLEQMVNQDDLPVYTVPNWVDTEYIKPIERADNLFAIEQTLTDQMVVMYSGNLGETHAIETIVDVAECLRHDARIRFLIIGEGSKRGLVEEAIGSGRTPNIRLLPWQPFEQLPFTLSTADIGIVTLGHGYEGLSMPSKTINMLAAGSAILGISHAPNDLSDTIQRHQCGANFAPDQIDKIAQWITQMAKERQQLIDYKQAARQAAVDHYEASTCMQAMTDLVRQQVIGAI